MPEDPDPGEEVFMLSPHRCFDCGDYNCGCTHAPDCECSHHDLGHPEEP